MRLRLTYTNKFGQEGKTENYNLYTVAGRIWKPPQSLENHSNSVRLGIKTSLSSLSFKKDRSLFQTKKTRDCFTALILYLYFIPEQAFIDGSHTPFTKVLNVTHKHLLLLYIIKVSPYIQRNSNKHAPSEEKYCKKKNDIT